jgi:predicted branched-subunit amino acid permease
MAQPQVSGHLVAAPRSSGLLRWARSIAAQEAVRAGIRDVAPVAVAITPLALAVGLAIARSSLSGPAAWAGAPLVFAGSAHLAAVTLLSSGSAPLLVVGTALAVNARFAVYGASLSPLFEHQPRWFRFIGPHFLVDQTYTLVMGRVERTEPAWMRAYYLTCTAIVGAVWLPLVAVGIVIEPVFPASWPIGLAGSLMVASLLGTSLRTWRAVVVAAVGFGSGLVLLPITGTLTVLIATVLAVATSRITVPGHLSARRIR